MMFFDYYDDLLALRKRKRKGLEVKLRAPCNFFNIAFLYPLAKLAYMDHDEDDWLLKDLAFVFTHYHLISNGDVSKLRRSNKDTILIIPVLPRHKSCHLHKPCVALLGCQPFYQLSLHLQKSSSSGATVIPPKWLHLPHASGVVFLERDDPGTKCYVFSFQQCHRGMQIRLALLFFFFFFFWGGGNPLNKIHLDQWIPLQMLSRPLVFQSVYVHQTLP